MDRRLDLYVRLSIIWFCLLIVGSSQTRVTTRGDGSTQVYTPRHYPG